MGLEVRFKDVNHMGSLLGSPKVNLISTHHALARERALSYSFFLPPFVPFLFIS